jgi:hypothetical protein
VGEAADEGLRRAAVAGIAGPVGFLAMAFLLAVLRHDVIVAQGWASWPSSMALGGAVGIPMICTFLWLTACYTVLSLGALRPGLRSRAAWVGFLMIAAGDLLLAFPTDEPDVHPTWHGRAHLLGVVVVTLATLVAAAGVTRATRGRPEWRPWRLIAPVPFAAAALGAIGGFDTGWVKVVYVVGITLPVTVIGRSLRRERRDAPPSAIAARSAG